MTLAREERQCQQKQGKRHAFRPTYHLTFQAIEIRSPRNTRPLLLSMSPNLPAGCGGLLKDIARVFGAPGTFLLASVMASRRTFAP